MPVSFAASVVLPSLRRSRAAAYALIASAFLAASGATPAHAASNASAGIAADPSDPFLWLESVDSPRAQAWVKSQNARTLGVLQSDPRFAQAYADAVAVGEAKDRIPYPEIVAGRVYNFWQDATHVRGIWRRTSLADYRNAEPAWETVLDIDALAKADGKSWVFHGADCNSPSERRCLIDLSDGGEDASTVREFDVGTKQFVSGGFVLPHGKQNVAWVDDNTLMVAREWSPGELTASGYPFVIKRVRRGQSLDAASEIYRGIPHDVSVSPFVAIDGAGHRLTGFERGVSFFESETYVVTKDGPQRFRIPLKARIAGMLGGRVLIKTEEPWSVDGTTFPAGSLEAVDLASVFANPGAPKPTLVYAPGVRSTLEGVETTRDRVLISTLENVRGRAYTLEPARDGTWQKRSLELPDQSAVSVVAADIHGSAAFVSVTGFLTPSTLLAIDANTLAQTPAKALSAKFDASRDTVEQFEVASSDGTKIPYFVVRPKALALDGNAPTILYGYGGFAVSLTPSYSAVLGKLWLERGGVYVLANIRGGGEFGPAWHEAGLTTHRQLIYDDFAAVGRDLVARKITSAAHLGIEGGSNGGLLMGVEFTQHPELWHAVDIQVPLLDMLRFEQIAAGASWVGEYGTVTKPDERAFLASISPYAQLKAGVRYPEPFVWTTTKDDRVGPQHARKFAAKLAKLGDPYLFYEVTEGGHGAGADIKEKSFTQALEYTYFEQKLFPAGTASAAR